MPKDILTKYYPEVAQKLHEKQMLDAIQNVFKGVSMMKGEKGDKGDSGYTPIKNKDFFDGRDGKDGETVIGPKGDKGERGPKGTDGETIVGPRGKSGKDGSPDTAEDIAFKLNNLREAVDVTVIRGALSIKDHEDQSKKVLDGMAKIDGRVKLIDQRWGAHGGGLSKVSTDNTLTGNGTPSSPLHVVNTGGGGGSGFTTVNALETPNGSRTVFTFPTATSQPIFIDSDNALMRATAADGTINWTWNSSTNQATMTIPPNDDIVGIVSNTGGSGIEVDNELVSGSGTSFTLSQTPILGSQHIYARGQRLTPTVDYSISGTSITTVDTWTAGDILADYLIGTDSGTQISNEIALGSGTSFTLSQTPLTGTEKVYAKGQRLTPTVDFSISGSSITTVDTWNSGDILVDYSV